MPVFARPSSDVAAGTWTATPLWQKVDETPYDDADYISGPSRASSTCQLGLSSVTDPAMSTGHTIRVRAYLSNTGLTLTFALYCGTTLIKSWNPGVTTGSFAPYEYTLTAGEADAITNYADLRFHCIQTYSSGTGTRRAYVSFVEFEVPIAPTNVKSNTPAFVKGGISVKTNQPAYLFGALSGLSNTPAYLEGSLAFAKTSRAAFLSGTGPDIVTLQPDSSTGIDTWLDSANPSLTYTNDENLRITTTGRALIKMPLAAYAGRTVLEATLYLYNHTANWTERGTIHIARILTANSSWIEGASWDYRVPSTARWTGDAGGDGGADAGCSVAGTDFSSTDLASVAMGNLNEGVGYEWVFPLDVDETQAMLDANNGMVLWDVGSTAPDACSCEHATAAYRPKLVLTLVPLASAKASCPAFMATKDQGKSTQAAYLTGPITYPASTSKPVFLVGSDNGKSSEPAYVIGGATILTNPQTVNMGTSGALDNLSPDGVNWNHADPILVDKYNNIIALINENSTRIGYFAWSNDGGSTWTCSGTAAESPVIRGSLAYDAANNTILVAFISSPSSNSLLFRRFTINYDGSNHVSSISKDSNITLTLDSGVDIIASPNMVFMTDSAFGSYGALVVIWSARRAAGSPNNTELRSTMRVLSGTSADNTASNWKAPVTTDTTTIGASPAVPYSILLSGVLDRYTSSGAHRKVAGTNAKDIYVFYHNGVFVGSNNEGTFLVKRMRWNNTNNDFSTGLSSPVTLSNLVRAGSNTGYSEKYDIHSSPREDQTNDRLYFVFSTYKDNTAGDTTTLCYLNCANDTVSSLVDVDSYKITDTTVFNTCDVTFDQLLKVAIISYTKQTNKYTYFRVYDGTALVQGETAINTAVHADIPVEAKVARYNHGGVDKLLLLTRNFNWPAPPYTPPYQGYLFTLDYISGTPKTSQKVYLEGGISGTPASASSPAYSKGLSTLLGNQPAYTKGLLNTQASQPGYLAGRDQASGSKPAFIHGKNTARSTAPAWLTGGIVSSAGQGAFLAGGSTLTGRQSGYATGKATGKTSQTAYTAGTPLVPGVFHAFTQGQATALSNQPIYVHGQGETHANLPVYLVGHDNIQGLAHGYLLGCDHLVGNIPCFLKGTAQGSSATTAYLEGGTGTGRASKPAYLYGRSTGKASTPALAHGQAVSQTQQAAYLEGLAGTPKSSLSVYLHGEDYGQSNQQSYTRGSATGTGNLPAFGAGSLQASSGTSAFTRGQQDTQGSTAVYAAGCAVGAAARPVYLAGWDHVHDHVSAFMRGGLVGNGHQAAFLYGVVLVRSSNPGYLEGTTPGVSVAIAYLKGQDNAYDAQPGYLAGGLLSSTSTPAYLRARNVSGSHLPAYTQGLAGGIAGSKHAFLSGTSSTAWKTPAYTAGGLVTSGSIHAFIGGRQDAQVSAEGFLAGRADQTSVIHALTVGQAALQAAQTVYTRGQVPAHSPQTSFLAGSQDGSSALPTYLFGGVLERGDLPAYLEGQGTESLDSSPAYLWGILPPDYNLVGSLHPMEELRAELAQIELKGQVSPTFNIAVHL